MSHSIERDWTTKAGLRAICLWGDNTGHRCGYVEVPKEHPLFGVEYNEDAPVLREAWEKAKEEPIGKRGIIPLFCADGDKAQPELVFNVHGSLTYSKLGNGYPTKSDGWWFGFDCGHADDKSRYCNWGIMRTEEYVVAECESLAEQLAAVKPAEEPATAQA